MVESVDDAVEEFVGVDYEEWRSTFVLLVGEGGSGKSYCCDSIVARVKASEKDICVVYPKLPGSLMGKEVGYSEKYLVSLFHAALASRKKCLLVMDGMEHIIGKGQAPKTQMEIGTKTCFLHLVDTIADNSFGLLVLCTASSAGGDLERRLFRGIFPLPPLDEEARRRILSSAFPQTHTREFRSLVASTAGRSAAELARYCRSALGGGSPLLSVPQCAPPPDDVEVVHAPSLLDSPPTILCGKQARGAWEELKSLLIPPLCQSSSLSALLPPSLAESNLAGALLVGPSGSGKTALAGNLARHAASLLPQNFCCVTVSCTSLLRKEVGGSEDRLVSLFRFARNASPCLLVLDNIEVVAPLRGTDTTTEGTFDRLLSTLLTEMDGVDRSPRVLAVIGIARDRARVDPALLRPGRLGKCLHLALPDARARAEIALGVLEGFPPEGIPDARRLADHVAECTPGTSADRIQALCREALADGARLGDVPTPLEFLAYVSSRGGGLSLHPSA